MRDLLRLIGMASLVSAVVGCRSEAPPFAAGTVRGQVWVSGPVSGATVRAYQLTPEGTVVGEMLGESAPTSPDGVFEVAVGPGTGTLLLEVSGGSAIYDELATGERIHTDPEVIVSGALTGFEADETRESVVLTPLTTAAVSLARARLALGKEPDVGAAADMAYALLGAHFGGIDLGRTYPADPTAGPAPLTAELRHGLILAALSRMAASIAEASGLTSSAVHTVGLTVRIADDLASPEALFDGVGARGAVSIGACERPVGCEATMSCDTLCDFDPNTMRADLGMALVAFVRSSRNQSGRAYEDVAQLVEAIRTNDEPELFPPVNPDQVDETPPQISWDAPTPADGAVVRGQIAVRAIAVDDFTVHPAIAWTAPPFLSDPGRDLDGSPSVVWSVIDTTTLLDGDLVVAARATDEVLNVAHATRRFIVDNTPPAIVVGGVVDGHVYAEGVVPTVTIVEAHPATQHVTLNGAPFVSGTPVTADGAYTLAASATDAAGNGATASVGFTIDKTSPAITIVSPAPGAVLRGEFTVAATATDLTLASFAITGPAALAGRDDDPAPERVQASIPQGLVADGPVTISLSATDQAGHAESASVSVVLDNVPPAVTLTSPVEGQWVAAPWVTVTGTAIDATSDVVSVTIEVGGAVTAATLTGDYGARTFSATVALSDFGLCTASNELRVRAADQAGNVSAYVILHVNYDSCDPTVNVVPQTGEAGAPPAVLDEREYGARFKLTTYQPCLFQGTGQSTFAGYDLYAPAEPLATARPAIYKYAINFAPLAWACPPAGDPGYLPNSENPVPPSSTLDTGNPITFYLVANDNRGVAQVEFSLRAPDGTSYGTHPAVADTTGGATHRVVLSGAAPFGLTAAEISALSTLDGTWEMHLVVTDLTGRVASPKWPLKWTHHVLGGPLYIQDDTPTVESATTVPPGYVIARDTVHSLALNNMAPLYTSTKAIVKRYKVFNGSGRSTRVSLAVPNMGMWSRTLRDRTTGDGDVVSGDPGCPEAFKLPTTPLVCIPFRVDQPDASTSGSITKLVQMIEARAGGSLGSTTLPELTPDQWTVVSAPGVFGVIDVYLLATPFTWLWDADPIAPADLAAFTAGGTTYQLFGYKEPWGYWLANPVPPPVGWTKKQMRARYLQSASVTASIGPDWEVQLDAGNWSHFLKSVDSKDFSYSFSTSEPTPLL